MTERIVKVPVRERRIVCSSAWEEQQEPPKQQADANDFTKTCQAGPRPLPVLTAVRVPGRRIHGPGGGHFFPETAHARSFFRSLSSTRQSLSRLGSMWSRAMARLSLISAR